MNGVSASGKPSGFEPDIRRFESSHPREAVELAKSILAPQSIFAEVINKAKQKKGGFEMLLRLVYHGYGLTILPSSILTVFFTQRVTKGYNDSDEYEIKPLDLFALTRSISYDLPLIYERMRYNIHRYFPNLIVEEITEFIQNGFATVNIENLHLVTPFVLSISNFHIEANHQLMMGANLIGVPSLIKEWVINGLY